ncbi:MAG: hypothetical protein GWP91_02865, partial [Rhodobacterales bacterium]|nr:hypothetical protein [Rhodobacterales bacterium]
PLHPDLIEVAGSGVFALRRLGVNLSQMLDWSKDARKRGQRRRAFVFGWHPKGHTWFAAPEIHDGTARVWVINRLDGLSVQDLSLDEFKACVNVYTREALTVVAQALVEEEQKAEGIHPSQRKPEMRIARVVIPENEGCTVQVDDQVETLNADELGYIRWYMAELKILETGKAPDLTRWQDRCLRSSRLDAVPAPGHADRSAYDQNWNRITRSDRTASGAVSYQVASWKFAAPGSWVLAEAELAILRRADQSTPRRHSPSAEQKAIWGRWMAMVKADLVELHVK